MQVGNSGGGGGGWSAVVNEVMGFHEHEDNAHGPTKREGVVVEQKRKRRGKMRAVDFEMVAKGRGEAGG